MDATSDDKGGAELLSVKMNNENKTPNGGGDASGPNAANMKRNKFSVSKVASPPSGRIMFSFCWYLDFIYNMIDIVIHNLFQSRNRQKY